MAYGDDEPPPLTDEDAPDVRPSYVAATADEKLLGLVQSLQERIENGTENVYELAAEYAPKFAAVKPPESLGAAGFPTVPIHAVPDTGPVTWLVRDLWATEAVGFIGGEPKTFKSFMSAHIAVCVAAGVPVLGTYETTKGRVLMFNAEDRPAMTRSRIAAMCAAMDLRLQDLDLQLVDVAALRLDDAAQVSGLRATIARERPALLVLDPLRDLHLKNENDSGELTAVLAPLRLIQRDYSCAVMVVHHMSKLTEVNKRHGQRLRGSGALHGWVDSALYLSRHGDDVAVTVEQRGAPAPSAFAFAVRQAGMPGHESVHLERKATGPDAAPKSDATRARVKLALVGAIKADGPISKNKLRAVVKGNHKLKDELLTELFDERVATYDDAAKGWRWIGP